MYSQEMQNFIYYKAAWDLGVMRDTYLLRELVGVGALTPEHYKIITGLDYEPVPNL